jgi:hypothetical protein
MSGHEKGLAFVVRQPGLDTVRLFDGIALRIVELPEFEGAVEVLVIPETLAERFLDRGAKLCGMLG